MRAIRARHAYDGESFLGAGATVLVEDGLIIGAESYGFQVPGDCLVTGHEGTLLPGLIDAHAHLGRLNKCCRPGGTSWAGFTEPGCVWRPGSTPASGQPSGTACFRMPCVS
jgi:hypothetical protein